jgi:hypothetical protein
MADLMELERLDKELSIVSSKLRAKRDRNLIVQGDARDALENRSAALREREATLKSVLWGKAYS